jgi:hypothetical protein
MHLVAEVDWLNPETVIIMGQIPYQILVQVAEVEHLRHLDDLEITVTQDLLEHLVWSSFAIQ